MTNLLNGSSGSISLFKWPKKVFSFPQYSVNISGGKFSYSSLDRNKLFKVDLLVRTSLLLRALIISCSSLILPIIDSFSCFIWKTSFCLWYWCCTMFFISGVAGGGNWDLRSPNVQCCDLPSIVIMDLKIPFWESWEKNVKNLIKRKSRYLCGKLIKKMLRHSFFL